MKKTKRLFLTLSLSGILVAGSCISGSTQSLTSAIDSTLNFLRDKTPTANTVRTATFEFSMFDSPDLGVISGKGTLVVDSSMQTLSGRTLKRYFLRATANTWVNTGRSVTSKTFTFTTPLIMTAASILSISSSTGTTSNSIPYNTPATKTENSTSNANEYIISGFLDPANPKKYITIRITQSFITFG